MECIWVEEKLARSCCREATLADKGVGCKKIHAPGGADVLHWSGWGYYVPPNSREREWEKITQYAVFTSPSRGGRSTLARLHASRQTNRHLLKEMPVLYRRYRQEAAASARVRRRRSRWRHMWRRGQGWTVGAEARKQRRGQVSGFGRGDGPWRRRWKIRSGILVRKG